MADRTIHYEAAFEALLRERGIPCVAVDEAKKAIFARASLKSFDFVVYSRNGPNLLVDVKGRKCLGEKASRQTWVTETDVDDLAEWEQVFGDGFLGLIAFVYWIDAPLLPEPGMFSFRDRWYLSLGVTLSEYRNRMRRRSERWKTVALATEDFRQLARPIESWL
jgi:hypothetical protein